MLSGLLWGDALAMGRILTLSGPRGVGKTAIIEKLRDEHGIASIVPYTTRKPRSAERNGIDYHFVSDAEFEETARVSSMFDVLATPSGRYGTPLFMLEQALDDNTDVSFNIATHTALELRKRMRQRGRGAVLAAILLPASWDDIAVQMRQSGIPEDEIAARLAVEPTDFSLLPSFDRIFINRIGHLDQTVSDVVSYLEQ